MAQERDVVPVVLFAYARLGHLERVLSCLRENGVPQLVVYADGPKGALDTPAVEAVRARLRAIDWCERQIVERERNLGLGANIMAGVTEVASRHETFMVWEDDLVCVPGTYAWLAAALRHYRDDARVMSVTGWTHPRGTPDDAGSAPYFDGRAECWVWGSWARAWRGMPDATAEEKMHAAQARGIRRAAYGADLPRMARDEQARNIWAVRWLYHHLERGGLCLRPPWSMVEHLGFDASATNASGGSAEWSNPPLRPAPPVPSVWPEPDENPACRRLWADANPGDWRRRWRRLRANLMGAR